MIHHVMCMMLGIRFIVKCSRSQIFVAMESVVSGTSFKVQLYGTSAQLVVWTLFLCPLLIDVMSAVPSGFEVYSIDIVQL